MPDMYDQSWLDGHLDDWSGYIGFYLDDEVVFTKITFRLLH